MVRINHCRDCNKDFVECETCLKTFKTNILSAVEIVNHDCTQEEAGGETTKRTAAAAGVAGGAAAGTAAGVGVTAGAPAALGAVGFTSSGVAGGSIAASLQSLLYAGATPAGGWFATCTSAAMGGAAGTAAVTAVAATGGIAVAAGAGYGLYRFLKKKKMNPCPWCNGNIFIGITLIKLTGLFQITKSQLKRMEIFMMEKVEVVSMFKISLYK